MDEDARFWVLDFDKRDHLSDLVRSLIDGEIECLVDEEAGGIVAYVINPVGMHRTEEFVAALTVTDEG
jgi:hypothetical protein